MVSSPFASASVARHIVRGVIGLVAVIACFAAIGPVGPVALLLLPVAAVAWRGCPTCWTVGLIATRAQCQVRPQASRR